METLSDAQIEAVFAHEIGHIVHHHMIWYVVFFGATILAAAGPGQVLTDWLAHAVRWPWLWGPSDAAQMIREFTGAALLLGLMLGLFGYISRRFERQADVFAARMLETNWGPRPRRHPPSHLPRWPVRRRHLRLRPPPRRGHQQHPRRSPQLVPRQHRQKRIRYVEQLSADPTLTGLFDRTMSRLYTALVVVLVMCGAIAAVAK